MEEGTTSCTIGPIKITKTGTVSGIELEVKTGAGYNTTIDKTKVTMKNASGETITSIPVGQEFYIEVPSENVEEGVQVTVKGKSLATSKTLWADATGTEQPIVEVKKEKEDLSNSITVTTEKEFDLALRKQIVEVNGVSTIYNEEGINAVRNIEVDTSKLKDGTEETAIYKHRKDPVVVKTGDIVTYRLHIYNEGDIDGYASKIVDQLPAGLKMSSEMTDTITSSKGPKP